MRLLTLLSFAACTADPHKADPTNDTAPPDDSTPPSHPDFPGTGTHRYDAARSGVQQGDPATWSGDWQSRWSQTVGRTSAVITAGDRLFSVEESFVRARSTTDGSLIWEQSLPDTGAGLTVGMDRVFVQTRDLQILSFFAADGSSDWSAQLGEEGAAAEDAAPLLDQGHLYVSAAGLYALNAEDGTVEWSWQDDWSAYDVLPESRSPSLAAGVLVLPVQGYVCHSSQCDHLQITSVYAFDPAAGSLLWSREWREWSLDASLLPLSTDRVVVAGLSFSGDGSQTSSNEGRMDVLNLLTGQEEWSITLDEAEELRGSPVVDGGWIYGGRRDWEGREGLHRAVAWSLEDGHEGWSTALDPAAGPTRVGELLLVPELGTTPGLSLLSATCGVIMARHDQTGSYPLPPLVDGDTVYVYDATGGTLGALALPSALPDPADMDGDGAPASADCNDCDPQVLPGAADRVGDDQDNNCDGVDGTDEDADGYAGAGSGGTDCDDGDASVYPGALEVWYDGLDQDCGEDSDFDADQDGHESADYGGVDCDDTDAAIAPGATEVWYDGVDQNCNGSSDYDADFDGYDATSGGGTDCDDTDAVVNPGVVERCNTSVDDNCDGDTNDNGAYQCDSYALDADGDGYGDPTLGDCFCTLPTGYSDNTDDCDDADGAVNPSATEVCSDGVDNNCDDSAAGCGVVGLFDLSNADDRLEGVTNSDELGWAIAAGDVDALPGADVLVSAILEDAGGTQAGAVYLLSGGSTDLADPTAAAAKLTGEDTADYAGKAVGLEDFDQDGLSELLVGAPGGGSTGGGVVYLVSPASASGTVSLGMATARWDGEASGDEAGAQLGTGDLTGDGQPDLLIGARKDSSYASESGAVYLIGAPLSSGLDLSTATAKIQGTTIRDYLGTGVTVGDFNGDGVGDLVVGAPGAGSGGSIWLLEGPLSGTSTVASATARLNGENSGDSVGSKLVTGDCDGDGLDDLVVGAPGVGSLGATYLVRGGFSGTSSLSTAFSKWAGEGPNDASGSAVALGDTNGDGSLDLQMGAVGEDAGGTDAGAVYLVLGPLSSGTLYMNSSNVDAKIEGDFQSSATGSALSFGDLDADGYEELLIGAVERNALDGALYVLAGGGL